MTRRAETDARAAEAGARLRPLRRTILGQVIELAVAAQALVSSRADQVAEITPEGGPWGSWRQSVYCNPGTWAVGFQQRVEARQGSGDDTALNSVKLICADAAGSVTERIVSHAGLWGTWSSDARCRGFATGARLKVEK